MHTFGLMKLISQLFRLILVSAMVLSTTVVAATSKNSHAALLQKQDEAPNPNTILRRAKFIYVRSSSLLVGVSVIEDKLRKRPEFQQAGLLITRDVNEADIILEVHHDLFTMYVFTAVSAATNVVVASGKLSSLGGTVAGKVAKRFMKQLMRARS